MATQLLTLQDIKNDCTTVGITLPGVQKTTIPNNKYLTKQEFEEIVGFSFNELDDDNATVSYIKDIRNYPSNKLIPRSAKDLINQGGIHFNNWNEIYNYPMTCYILSNNNVLYTPAAWKNLIRNWNLQTGSQAFIQKSYEKMKCFILNTNSYAIQFSKDVYGSYQFAKASGSSFMVDIDIMSNNVQDHLYELQDKGCYNTREYYDNSQKVSTSAVNRIYSEVRGGLFNNHAYIPAFGDYKNIAGFYYNNDGTRTDITFNTDPFGQSRNENDMYAFELLKEFAHYNFNFYAYNFLTSSIGSHPSYCLVDMATESSFAENRYQIKQFEYTSNIFMGHVIPCFPISDF